MPIEPIIRNTVVPAVTSGITILQSVPAATLIRSYNLQNVRVIQPQKNQYEGLIDQTVDKDPAIEQQRNYIDTPLLLAPVVTDLNLPSVTYTDPATGRRITTQSLYFACVLISLTQPKRIVKTEIQGRDGTVKEYIGKDDAQVTISGIIVGGNGKYPFDEVTELKRTLDAPVPRPVVNPHLNAMNIFYLVVDGYDIPQEAGRYSQQNFTIQTVSDTPIELQLQ